MSYRSSSAGDVPGAPIVSATPALALYNEFVAAFNAHDNWDFVEDVVITTVTHHVWRNRGATGLGLNSFGQDFYVVLSHNTDGTGDLSFRSFEAWDAAAKTAIRPVTGNTTNQTRNANFSHGDEVAGFALSSATIANARLALLTTGFDFWIQVSKDRLCAAVRQNNASSSVYAGLFQSLMASDPFPLCLFGTNTFETFSSSDGGWSRHPGGTTANQFNFMAALQAWTVYGGSLSVSDVFHGGPLGSRLLVRPFTAPESTYGRVRGLLLDCIAIPTGTIVSAVGDTITVDAEPWVRMNFGNSNIGDPIFVKTTAV